MSHKQGKRIVASHPLWICALCIAMVFMFAFSPGSSSAQAAFSTCRRLPE